MAGDGAFRECGREFLQFAYSPVGTAKLERHLTEHHQRKGHSQGQWVETTA